MYQHRPNDKGNYGEPDIKLIVMLACGPRDVELI